MPERVFDTATLPAPEWSDSDKCARCPRTYMTGLGIKWTAWRQLKPTGTLYGPWTSKMYAFLPER